MTRQRFWLIAVGVVLAILAATAVGGILWLIAVSAVTGVVLGVINSKAVADVHILMNSRLEELIRTATDKAFLLGGEAARTEMREQLSKTDMPGWKPGEGR